MADGRFEVMAKAVYSPLLEWVNQQVKVAVHAAEEESTGVTA